MRQISLIVPVYNAEKYLPRCLDSILDQTVIDSMEIIIIDDGSTDSSSDILEVYAEQFNNFRVVRQNNRGQAAANNLGIQMASSEYVGFADSDDWLERDMYEKLYKTAIESDADLVLCNIMLHFDTHERVRFASELFNNRIITDNSEKVKLFEMLGSWNKLIRRSLLTKKNIHFQAEERTFTDHVFSIRTIIEAEKIALLDEPLYNYNKTNPVSVTRNRNHRLLTVFPVIDYVHNILKKAGIPNYRDFFNGYKTRFLFNSYHLIDGKYKRDFFDLFRHHFQRKDIPQKINPHKRFLLLILPLRPLFLPRVVFSIYIFLTRWKVWLSQRKI